MMNVYEKKTCSDRYQRLVTHNVNYTLCITLLMRHNNGDRLASSTDKASSTTMRSVLITDIPTGRMRMVTFPSGEGLCNTTRHLLQINVAWFQTEGCGRTENGWLVVSYTIIPWWDSYGTRLIVNDTLCKALGHGMKGNTRGHEFWRCHLRG